MNVTYNDLPRPKPLPKGWWRRSHSMLINAYGRQIIVDIYGAKALTHSEQLDLAKRLKERLV